MLNSRTLWNLFVIGTATTAMILVLGPIKALIASLIFVAAVTLVH